MFSQKELIENICTQIKDCLMIMKLSTIEKKDRLLKLESRHLDLLLKLLQSEIDIKSYIRQFILLYPDEEWYDYIQIHTPHILFLEQQQIDIVSIDDEVVCFINILQICNDNIKKYIEWKKYKEIEEEIYFNHNVPSFIFSWEAGKVNDWEVERINHYLSKCDDFRARFSKEMTQPYESTWEQINQQFLP